jgi:hypothetical protein
MINSRETNQAAVHFFEVEYTTAVKGLPHSKQLAFNRDVISPQFGHILCPDSATSDFISRLQSSSRIVNSTISRPREMLAMLIKSRPFLASPCRQTAGADHSLAEKPKVEEFQMDWLRSEDLKEEKNVTAPIAIVAGLGMMYSISMKTLVQRPNFKLDLY